MTLTRAGVLRFGKSVALFGVAAAALYSLSSNASAGAGRAAPPVTVQDLSGRSVHLNFRGKVHLLAFWATWCPPCRAEVPDLKAFESRFGKRGFEVDALSMDDGAAAVRPFVHQAGITYPVYMANPVAARAYGGVAAIPAGFLIDRSGRIVKSYVGLQDPREVARDIDGLLAGRSKHTSRRR